MIDNARSLEHVIPGTEYFEIDSTAVGARFAVWVTRPSGLGAGQATTLPVLYVTDGYPAAALTGPYASLLGGDLITRLQPFLQVAVGYAGAESAQASTLRNRDLVPPGEPVSPQLIAAVDATVDGGGMSRQDADAYVELLRNPHGDRFLTFFEEELQPAIADRYDVQPGPAGLFGYSYGGLFSLYVLLRQSPMFNRIGAGSPGIAVPDSQIFSALRRLAERHATFVGVQLCLTINELELIGPSALYRVLGRYFLALVDDLAQADFEGLRVSKRIVPEESHLSGWMASYLTFLRTCYAVAG
jgi:predicted alpha/beta superfamily hydrolase